MTEKDKMNKQWYDQLKTQNDGKARLGLDEPAAGAAASEKAEDEHTGATVEEIKDDDQDKESEEPKIVEITTDAAAKNPDDPIDNKESEDTKIDEEKDVDVRVVDSAQTYVSNLEELD